MGYEKSSLNDREYRDKMDMPMESLAVAMWGIVNDGPQFLDYEIVEKAAAKIIMLRDMLIAAGVNENLIKAAMKP